MSLENWVKNGWLVRHASSAGEIADLLDIADRDLADCRTPRLSDDWRFAIAYNAALQLATAALAASGFRPARGQSHHLRAFQSLAFTIGLESSLIDLLDAFRSKRNAGTYDRAGAVSATDAQEMFNLAKSLRSLAQEWFKANYPELFNS